MIIILKIIIAVLLGLFIIGKMADSFNNKDNIKMEVVYYVEIIISIICTIILFRL